MRNHNHFPGHEGPSLEGSVNRIAKKIREEIDFTLGKYRRVSLFGSNWMFLYGIREKHLSKKNPLAQEISEALDFDQHSETLNSAGRKLARAWAQKLKVARDLDDADLVRWDRENHGAADNVHVFPKRSV